MKPRFNFLFRIASPMFLALSMGTVHAVPLYWDISATSGLTAGSGTWGTSAFWATSSAPATATPGAWTDGSDAFFQTAATNTVAIAAAGVSANSVTQTTASTATTISSGGGTLSITGTGGIVNSGNTAFTINSPVNLNGTNTYTFQSTSTMTMGGAIGETGTAGISKTGNSVLNLNAANTFSGGITINAGRISVGASGNLGTNAIANSIVVAAGANLALSAAANIGASQTVSVSSSPSALGGIGVGYAGSLPTLVTTGTGTDGGVFGINFTGTAGFSSLATLDTTLNASGGSGHWYLGSQTTGTFDGATLATASDSIYRLGGGGGTLTFTQSNVLTGANDLQIGSTATNGGGTVVLSAAQNFTGATTVSGGTLKLGNAGALGDATTHTSGLAVNGSGIFDFGGFSPTYNTLSIILNSSASGFDVGSFTNSGSAVTFGGTVELQAATVRAGANANAMTLTGTLTGNGKNFIKDGSNNMTLSNAGTVSLGTLQIYRGTLQINSGTALNPSGNFTLGGGANVGNAMILNGGSLTVGSARTATFGSGSGSAASTVTLTSGTLTVPKLTKGTQNFSINFNGGMLKANAASTTFIASGIGGTAKVQSGGAVIDDGGYPITIGQSLIEDTASTGGGLTKSGNGTLTLSGVNTYTGGTAVNSGTLDYLNLTAKPASGTTTVAANATLGLGVGTGLFASTDVDALFAGSLAGVTISPTSNVGIDTTAAGFTYSSSVPANTKGLVKLGANTLTLNGANAYTGGTTVLNGALTLLGDQTAATGGFALDISNAAASTLNIGSGSQTASTSALVTTGKTVQLGAIGGGALGTGFQSLTVNGASTFPTVVANNGTLGVGRNSTLSVNNYATWTQNGSMNIEGLGGYTGQITLNTGGSFVYAGSTPINLTASSGMTGFTRLYVNGGSLTTGQAINFNGNSGTTGVASFVLYGNGTLKLSANIADLVTGDSSGLVYFANGGSVIDTNGFNTTLSRSVTDFPANVGALTKQGLGKLTISNSATYTGATTVTAGTLEVTGSLGATAVTVQNNATVSGNGNLGGNVTIQSGGHHALAVAATTGAQVTRTIAGVLDLTAVGNILDLSAASPPAVGGPYVLVTATGGITGSPTTVNLSGLAGTVAVNGNNLELTVTAGPAGFSSWIGGFAVGGLNQPGDDYDRDGITNLLEYVLNGNPSISNTAILPTLNVTATDFEFAYSRLDLSLADTTQTFQYGSDLSGWSSIVIPAGPGTVPVGIATVTVTDTGTTDSVKVSIPKTAAMGGKLLGRLKVTQP